MRENMQTRKEVSSRGGVGFDQLLLGQEGILNIADQFIPSTNCQDAETLCRRRPS